MNNPRKRKTTALSSYVWDLKDSSTPYHLRWSILARAQPYKGILRECNLCSEEALRILLANYPILNKRSELVTSCRHKSLSTFAHYRLPCTNNTHTPPIHNTHTHHPPRPHSSTHTPQTTASNTTPPLRTPTISNINTHNAQIYDL